MCHFQALILSSFPSQQRSSQSSVQWPRPSRRTMVRTAGTRSLCRSSLSVSLSLSLPLSLSPYMYIFGTLVIHRPRPRLSGDCYIAHSDSLDTLAGQTASRAPGQFPNLPQFYPCRGGPTAQMLWLEQVAVRVAPREATSAAR